MVQYVWQDSYSVGVKEIDDQHKMLFKLIEKLHKAVEDGDTKQAISDIIPELVKYTMYHFETEEDYMRKYRYEGYSAHKERHFSFITELKEYIKELVDNKSGLSIKLLVFLNDWLVNHIQSLDQELGPFLAKHLDE